LNFIETIKFSLGAVGAFLVLNLNAQNEQVCYASFYHHKFHGRKTSDGNRLNNKSYTCAHRTLPFGTKVEITNLENGKFVVATVTDRGPFAKNRCVDVTYQIAKDLDFVQNGTTKVQLKVLQTEPLWYVIKATDTTLFENRFGVKIGSFTNYAEAALAAKKVKECCGAFVNLGRLSNTERSFLLIAGNFASAAEAQNLISNFPHDISSAEIFEYNEVLNALK
jgi:rare lipoprotein A